MKKARAAAGIKQRFRFANGVTGVYQRYTREQLIEQLRTLEQRLGRTPKYRDIVNAGRSVCASVPTFTSMFGSLADAYEAAGFKLKPATYSDKEIVTSLRRLKGRLGRFPTPAELRRASRSGECPHPDTVIRRLGRLEELQEWI
jgi:hypothetical protein